MSVFSFSGYLVAVNVCPECRGLHSKQVFRFLRQEPVCYPAYIDRHTKEVVNMLLAVIVLPSYATNGDMITLCGSVQP